MILALIEHYPLAGIHKDRTSIQTSFSASLAMFAAIAGMENYV
jgi:hypothetical protein